MRRARATRTAESCSLSQSWSSTRRNASAAHLASACLAHGHGTWVPLQGAQTEPYLLTTELEETLKREPRHWWGICGSDLKRDASTGDISGRPARPSILHEWTPDGRGCDALRKGNHALPEFDALACSFCALNAGRTVVFVGDSVQGELFLAFASILGARSPRVNPGNEGCRRVAPRGSGKAELDMSMEVPCSSDGAVITLRFIRNELLWLDDDANARTRHPDRRLGAPALMLCNWRSAVQRADYLILNRGYHSLAWSNATREVEELADMMRELSLVPSLTPLSDHVIFRGTHASFRSCSTRPDPETGSYDKVASLMRSRSNSQYNWRSVEGRASGARTLLESFGVPYLDTYFATALRPGGRMPNSCNHFCLPGPVDEWVRLLLAWWS